MINLENKKVLVIGDLHAPFTIEGYLAFCAKQYTEFNCDTVVFIGDLVDSHYSSFHETDPNGLGGGDELSAAKNIISKWYETFPEAHVLFGNHDNIVSRKAYAGDIPKEWIKSMQEVFETPNWTYQEELIIDDVLYIHGIGTKAHLRARNNMQSVAQGHHHTQAYVQFLQGKNKRVFGMQVGCGVDDASYAMAYGKWFPESAIACGIILEGKIAFNVFMDNNK